MARATHHYDSTTSTTDHLQKYNLKYLAAEWASELAAELAAMHKLTK
jgi:hypothetical protein